MQWIRNHVSFANAISMIALFVALGGTSIAAVQLSKNSVGAKQIKKNAVRAAEINRNAVGASEIRSNAVAGGDVADGGLTGADVGDGSLGSIDIADGSITNLDLGDNSVGSSKIVDGSVGPADLTPGAVTGGPTAYARVAADGTLEPGTDTPTGPPQSKRVDSTDIQHPAAGTYCFGDLGFPLASAVVAMDNAGAATTTTQVASVAIQRGANLNGCDAGHQQARVVITNVDPALAAAALVDGRFEIWFQG